MLLTVTMFNFCLGPAQTAGVPPVDPGEPDPGNPEPLSGCTFTDTDIGGGNIRVGLLFSGLETGNKIRFSIRDSLGTYYVTNNLGGTNTVNFPGIAGPTISIPSGHTLFIDAVAVNPTTLRESAVRTFTHII